MPELKVLLVGNYVPDQQRSMLGFAGALLSGLQARGVDARLISPRPIAGRFGSPHTGLGKWLGYLDKFGLFPRQLRRAVAWADVVHVCDHGNAMYVKHLQGVPHIVTCHDLLAMRAARGEIADWPAVGRTGRLFQQLILQGLRQSRSLVCVSETTRQDLLQVTGLPQARASVVYNGLYHAYRPMDMGEADPLLARLSIGPRFLLHVGGNQPYKNRLGLLKIYRALQTLDGFQEVPLVLAGKPFTAEMRAFVGQHGLEQVRELTGLTDDELRALYSRAEALLFPSLFEGFGLPVIEAQACGCPVFASDRAPMTEVGGDAAVYFDPTEPEQAARAIANKFNNLERMKTRGLENIRRFSTQQMLDGYVSIYKQAIKEFPN